MDDWLSFAVDAVGGACAFICLFEGTRRLVQSGASRNTLLMGVFGAAYCLLYGGYYLLNHRELREYSEALYRQVYRVELPPDWGSHLTAPRREAASQSLARSAFIESGTLRTYFDAKGARKAYSPTQADVKRRDTVVAQQTRLAESMRASLATGVLWLTWAVIAVLFGLGMAREKAATRNPPAV
jgi:hypothetical protein